MSDIHVSSDNIKSVLTGIVTHLNTEINKLDLTADEKAIVAKVDKIVTTGDGTKFLSDNGSYVTITTAGLSDAIDKVTNAYRLLGINGNDFNLNLSTDLQQKMNILKTDGDGTKILMNNGTYTTFTPVEFRDLTSEEMDSMINDLQKV